jgi:hypothetical protein
MLWERLPIGLVAAILFAAGAVRAAHGGEVDGYGMMSVSLVLAGCWLTLTLHDQWCDRHSGDWPR